MDTWFQEFIVPYEKFGEGCQIIASRVGTAFSVDITAMIINLSFDVTYISSKEKVDRKTNSDLIADLGKLGWRQVTCEDIVVSSVDSYPKVAEVQVPDSYKGIDITGLASEFSIQRLTVTRFIDAGVTEEELLDVCTQFHRAKTYFNTQPTIDTFIEVFQETGCDVEILECVIDIYCSNDLKTRTSTEKNLGHRLHLAYDAYMRDGQELYAVDEA